MRKFLVITLLAVLALTSLTGAVLAVDTDDLTALARYYPAETPMFVANRTDDAYIAELDAVLSLLNRNMDGDLLPPGFGLVDLLDQLAFDATGRSFERAFGWLGNTAALGLTSLDDIMTAPVPPLLVAFEVADFEAAREFWTMALGEFELNVIEEDDYIAFESWDSGLVLTEDVALLAPELSIAMAAYKHAGDTLADSELFRGTFDLLPLDSYNIALFVDNESVLAFNELMMMDAMMASPEPMPFDLSAFNAAMAGQDAVPAVVMAFTIVEGRNLVADIAVQVDEAVQMAAPGYVEQLPIDLDFAAYLPAYSQFVMLDNGFGPQVMSVFAALDAIGPMIQELIDLMLPMIMMEMQSGPGMGPGMPGQPDADAALEMLEMLDVSGFNLGGFLYNQLETLFAGFTGLNLEADVLNWMTGDYGMFISLIPVESDLEFSLDVGFVTEATDPDAAAAVVAQLAEAASAYRLDSRMETMGAGEALVLTAPIRLPLRALNLPAELLAQTPELDLLVGSDDEVFVVSSRPGAAFALERASTSLLDNAAYTYAQDTLFLDDTTTVLYIGTQALVQNLPAGVIGDPFLHAELQLVISQIESATITGSVVDGGSIARLTLTLPETVVLPTPVEFDMNAAADNDEGE